MIKPEDSYYEDGNLRQVKFANGVETNYIYNADKNYSNIVTKTAAGEILLNYSYAYDGNGNRTKKVGSDCVKKIEGNDSSIGATTYEYDSLQRLQKVSYPTGKVEQFQYHNAGNRALKKYGTAENFKTGNYLEERYQYDNRNRLLERRNAQDVTYYQYDKQGNTVSELTKRFLKPETTKVQQSDGRTFVSNSLAKTELEQYKTYEYNMFNQTSKVTVQGYLESGKEIHVQENFYDAENMRYGIEEGGSRTNFVTNGWSVFTELDKDWNVRNRLIRGYGIVASEEVEENVNIDKTNVDSYHFYHQNEHGDTEYITGQSCEIKNAYTYDAFGNITNSTELVKNRYTYNGEQYDTITNQYYLRARYYNPLAGRFTQEDEYRGDGLNLYAYCGNNPVMYVDPSGYSAYDEWRKENKGKYSRDEMSDAWQKYKDANGIDISHASKREQYMGGTPSKNSKVGRQVIARMEEHGYIQRNTNGEVIKFKSVQDGEWYNIQEANMSHKNAKYEKVLYEQTGIRESGHRDAVVYWNEEGKYTGAKSESVREYMTNPDNYYLELDSYNKADGASIRDKNGNRITYDEPEGKCNL